MCVCAHIQKDYLKQFSQYKGFVFSTVWGMTEEYDQVQKDRKERESLIKQQKDEVGCGFKRRKADDGVILIELPVKFDR